MLIVKNKIFKSKRLMNEVISDDQVRCLGSDLESVEIIEKDVQLTLVNFEDEIILRERGCNTQYFNQ